jgi:hypothetical protein
MSPGYFDAGPRPRAVLCTSVTSPRKTNCWHAQLAETPNLLASRRPAPSAASTLARGFCSLILIPSEGLVQVRIVNRLG